MLNLRLFEILTLLVDKKSVTAGELAERFNVSTRTIYRDIEHLIVSGVPIYTDKGNQGGIRIAKNYKIDSKLLSGEEKNIIMSSLQAESGNINPSGANVMKKVDDLFNKHVLDWIEVDFSSSGSNDIKEKEMFEELKKAIFSKNLIEFSYYGMSSNTEMKEIEPLRLVYRNDAWFLYAYYKIRNNYRFFKIRRMSNIMITKDTFDRTVIGSCLPANQIYETSKTRHIKLRITSEQSYRAFDDFDGCRMLKDGSIEVNTDVTEGEWLIELLLSYGGGVKIIEPLELKEEMKEKIKTMFKIYSK